METLYLYLSELAPNAHWIFFLLLLLAGMNIPISLDLILISGGIIGNLYIPDHIVRLYLFLLAGCILAAWEAYWIGRILGPKLYTIWPFSYCITKERVSNLSRYYERYGIIVFIVGRFVPGGVRNGIFMSSGLCNMPFLTFMLRDIPGCILSTLFLFSLGFFFAEKKEELFTFFKAYNEAVILCAIGIIILWIMFLNFKKKTKSAL